LKRHRPASSGTGVKAVSGDVDLKPSARLPRFCRTRLRFGRRTNGQSTVEFALIAPVLLLLLVGIADFGRVFTSGVVVEAAARNAAEVVAEEYVRNPPGDPLLTPAQRLAVPAPTPGNPSYYDDLALKAATAVCVEMRSLPNTSYIAATGTCPSWPLIRVCIHDQTVNNANNHCGHPITPGFDASPPAECDTLPPPGDPSWDPSMTGGGITPGGEPSRYVEVRVCYLFTTLLNVPAVPNSVLFQRTRMFTIACFQDPTAAGNNGSC
jgi:TadE-like protein